MANVLIDDTYLKNIADAIRDKNNTTYTYKPSQMAAAIENIKSSDGDADLLEGIAQISFSGLVDDGISYDYSEYTNQICGDSFTMPALTANVTEKDEGTYTASASSTYDSARQAYMPFNGTEDCKEYDCWHPVSGFPQWLQIELPEKVIIRQFTIKNRTTNSDGIKDFVFQASNDGEEWIDLGSYQFASTAASGIVATFYANKYFDGYRYYRWYITSGITNYGVIAKITINEAYYYEEVDV
jgi:hypothetical protein